MMISTTGSYSLEGREWISSEKGWWILSQLPNRTPRALRIGAVREQNLVDSRHCRSNPQMQQDMLRMDIPHHTLCESGNTGRRMFVSYPVFAPSAVLGHPYVCKFENGAAKHRYKFVHISKK